MPRAAASPVIGADIAIVRTLPHFTSAAPAAFEAVARVGDELPRVAYAAATAAADTIVSSTNNQRFLISPPLASADLDVDSGSFVCLVGPRGGVSGRVKDRDDAHRCISPVLERVNEQRRKVDARA